MTTYSYCVLRYVHDRAAGESLNVGVLFLAREAGVVSLHCEHRTRALSNTFRGFERDDFLRFIGWLESAVERLQSAVIQSQLGLFGIRELPEDADALARLLLPDRNGSFEFGAAGGGATRDAQATAEKLFQRLVVTQRPHKDKHERRPDDAVWSSFYNAARALGVTKALEPRIVQTPEISIAFEHSFVNEKTHAIETLSFDYADADKIQERAAQWLGNGLLLGENPNFGTLYFLLGEPKLTSQKSDFVKAQNILRRLPIKPKIYREEQTQEMVEEIADFMKEHGLIAAEEAESERKEHPISL